MAHSIVEYPLIIRENHLDTFGHMNNATYLQIFEDARWEWITQNGYDLYKIKETGLGPTLLEVTVRFMKELKLRTPVVIKSQIQSYEGKIMILKQWIESAGGVNHAEAIFTIALFDTQLRKLVPPTPEWLKAIGYSQ